MRPLAKTPSLGYDLAHPIWGKRMPDVILIYPRTLWDIKNVTTRLPLASLYIGTVLEENGFSAQVIDQRVDDAWETTLRQALRDRPLWVGISSMTGRQIHWGLEASQVVREVDPDIPIVWGGVHATILPEETLAHPLVDIVAVGEGEITALELSQAFRERGPNPEFSSTVIGAIAGLVWEHAGRVIRNVPRYFTPMDEWPLLDYDLVDVEHYVLAEVPGERSLQITTSRGCPFHCGYCYLTVVPDGRRYRAEKPERTVERIERMMRLFDLNAIHIIDDEFFTRRERARRVCELILERGIQVTLQLPRRLCRPYVDVRSEAVPACRVQAPLPGRRVGQQSCAQVHTKGHHARADHPRQSQAQGSGHRPQVQLYGWLSNRDDPRGQGHDPAYGAPGARESRRLFDPPSVVQPLSWHRPL
jgi:radical SAM superfamily enzyme YgiQ (UPF0313 family)